MNKRLYRSIHDKWVGGVCAGFADFFGLDVTWVRLGWSALTLYAGIGLVFYVLCWVIVPRQPASSAANTVVS